jgi:hypothetical protein
LIRCSDFGLTDFRFYGKIVMGRIGGRDPPLPAFAELGVTGFCIGIYFVAKLTFTYTTA